MKALVLTLILATAGCAQVTSKACTDQLTACGEKIAICAGQSGCNVSACIGTVLPTPTPAQ